MTILRFGCAAVLVVLVFAGTASAQTFREHARSTRGAEGTVEESQAAELTLTVAPVGRQSLQHWPAC